MLPAIAMAEDTPQYTIDELATKSRVPSRTIRFYQSKGALPAPTIRGRVAYYDDSHLERLKLIGQLQDRGLRIKAIRDLLARADQGELALNEWLGLESKLQEPWADDRPRVVDQAELESLTGAARRPGLIADLIRLGEVERRGDGYLVRSPGLLQIGLRLEAAGVDLETAVEAARILRRHLAKAAREVTDWFYRRVGAGFGRRATAQDLTSAFEALRPLGQEAVRLIFAQEIEKSLRHLLESGAATEIPARAGRRRR